MEIISGLHAFDLTVAYIGLVAAAALVAALSDTLDDVAAYATIVGVGIAVIGVAAASAAGVAAVAGSSLAVGLPAVAVGWALRGARF